jgi:hypothetical protein
MLSESLRRMRDNGGLRREIDPDDLASGMVSLLQGGILLSQARNDIGPLRSAVNVMPSRAVTPRARTARLRLRRRWAAVSAPSVGPLRGQ